MPSRRSQTQSPWRLLLGILCIGLVLIGATLSLTHSHSNGNTHGDCGLCTTAHSAANVDSSPEPMQLAPVLGEPAISSPLPRPRVLPRSALFARPPPDNAIPS